MQAYIAIGFANRSNMQEAIDAIRSALQTHGINAFVFVDQYRFQKTEEQKMMQQAMKEIDASDLLIAEVSEKAIGVGIEAGYAKGKGKPVVYCRQQTAEHATTLSGISNAQIIYANEADLQQQLIAVLKDLK